MLTVHEADKSMQSIVAAVSLALIAASGLFYGGWHLARETEPKYNLEHMGGSTYLLDKRSGKTWCSTDLPGYSGDVWLEQNIYTADQVNDVVEKYNAKLTEQQKKLNAEAARARKDYEAKATAEARRQQSEFDRLYNQVASTKPKANPKQAWAAPLDGDFYPPAPRTK